FCHPLLWIMGYLNPLQMNFMPPWVGVNQTFLGSGLVCLYCSPFDLGKLRDVSPQTATISILPTLASVCWPFCSALG
ncbi:ferric transport system permease protein FbpB, partial [Vibrio cholerae HC-68A1]